MKKIVILLAVGAVLLATSFTSLFNIRQISCAADYQLSEADEAWLYEQNWLWRDAQWIAQNLPDNMTYQDVVATKENLFAVTITATERAPFIAIKSGGYFVVIDMYGVVLDLSLEPDAPYVIEGFEVTSAVVGKPLAADEMGLVERAVQIVYMFKTYTDYAPSIKLKNRRIIQQMTDEIFIDFGQGDNVELQFNNALAAYENLIDNAGTSGIVNVSNPNQCIIEPLKR